MLGTLIYSVGVVWILRIGGFFSGGATGASQLIVGLFEKFSKNKDIITTISNNLGTFILLINIPLFVIGWRGLSKKFVLLTAVSIVLQTLVMNLLSKYTISPLCLLINDASVAGNVLRSGSYSEVVRNLLNNDAAGLIDIFRKSGFTIIKNADTDLAQELFKTYTEFEEGKALATPVREGYSFAGWYDNPEFSGEPITKLEKGIHSNIKVYAKFEKEN